MNLGNFNPDSRSGGYVGSIKTLTINLDNIRIVPRTKASGAKEGTPDFDVFGPNGSDFGAGWWQKRQSDGLDYISLQLYDPSFNNGETMRPALWPKKDNTGFTLVLNPLPEHGMNAASEISAPDRSAVNGTGRARRKSATLDQA